MYRENSETVCEILRSAGLVTCGQLDQLGELSRSTGRSLAEVAIEAGLVERRAVLSAVADFLGCEYLPAVPERISGGVATELDPATARMLGVVPIRDDGSTVDLLAIDPLDPAIVNDTGFVLGKPVRVVVADPNAVSALIVATYGDGRPAAGEDGGKGGGSDAGKAGEGPGSPDMRKLEDMSSQAPVVRFVDSVITRAVKEGAADIHFEPFEGVFRIRCRIGGTLCELDPPEQELATPVISRVKILADLDIAENRVPQDGRIRTKVGHRVVDLRVSTLPTRYGESVVLRVLDRSVVNLDLERLGLPPKPLESIRKIVRRPCGMFVVTGPTGSGKTTTLYSALKDVNAVERKILTVEDPVEYVIDGVMQVSVHHGLGLDFARTLRAFLRQDPDMIMVGEIRDSETAQVAVQASLTGHMVLSTMHTSDAAGAVTRFLDLGLEPYLIAAALDAILAQRLVRKICGGCRIAVGSRPEIADLPGVDPVAWAATTCYQGEGCADCGQTGYHGRTGLFEMLVVTEGIRELIHRRSASRELAAAGIAAGMQSLLAAGVQAIAEGTTTVEEVLRSV